MPSYPLAPINTVQLSQFQDWTDQYGMMQDNNTGDTTGNGNLFTAHYVVGLVLKNLIFSKEKDRINQVYQNNFIQQGLLTRAPSKRDDREAHDDIYGLIGAEALLNPENRKFTQAIFQYGASQPCNGVDPDPNELDLNNKVYGWLGRIFGKVKWVWNNVNPNTFHVSSWLGRRIDLIATLQMASGNGVNPLYWLYWAAYMLWLVYFKSDNDGYVLRFYSALAAQGYGPLTNRVCQMVRNAVKRDYGDFGQLLGAYFNNPNHPIVALLKDIS